MGTIQRITHFVMPETFNLDTLDVSYRKHIFRKKRGLRCYYDTFDRRIISAGFELFLFKNEIILRDHLWNTKGRLIADEMPLFETKFPIGTIRETLKKIIDVRALLCIYELRCSQQEVCFYNKNDKVVLKILLETLHYNNSESDMIGTVIGIAGYPKVLALLDKSLKYNKLKITHYPSIRSILKREERNRATYTSKPVFKFHAKTPSLVVAKEIFTVLTDMMEANEEGIITDIDSEFLHDYRVAIRRLRSALTQFKVLMPPDMNQWARQSFSQLGRMTNRLRDLDVFLQNEDRYKSYLPVEYRHYLGAFFREQMKVRENEHNNVCNFLNASHYRGIKKNWCDHLNRINLIHSSKPIRFYAKRWINHRIKLVIKLVRELDNTLSEEKLHRLRIAGKRLRYLLEFFIPLYPEKDIKPVLKQLKHMQDHLGNYNDYVVQQMKLRQYLQGVDDETRIALNLLIEILAEEQERESHVCLRSIRNFRAVNYSVVLN